MFPFFGTILTVQHSPVIGAARGLAIILVVYGHIIQRTMMANGADFFSNPAFKAVYTFHMPLFVFISGYLVFFSLSRRSEREVFKSRCKSLLVPFLSWGVLGIVTGYIVNVWDGKSAGINLPWDLADQLFIHPAVWFLFTLFVLSCLLLGAVKLEKRLGAWVFAVIYLLLLAIPYNDYCSLYYIKWFYVFYAAGYLVNKHGIKITDRALNLAVFAAALLLFIILVSFWTADDFIYINKMGFGLNRLGYRYLTGFLGILIVLYTGALCSKTKIGGLLDYIGIYSLDIYLIQRYLVEGLYPRFVQSAHINFDFNSPFFLYFFAPMMALAFTGLCMVISRALIRKSDVLNRLLLGGRA